ncbi:tetratricopeptide repeat protein [Myxococcus hansupus]
MSRLLQEGRWKEALDAATHQLAQNPGHEESLLVSAKVALLESRPEQAEKLLSRVKGAAVQQEVTLVRAAAAVSRSDFAGARLFYQSLIHQPRPPAEAWHGLGLALLALGQTQEAVVAHERAVSLQPEQAGFRFEFGHALDLANKPRAAARQFVQCLRLDSQNIRGYWALAYLLSRKGKTLSARRILDKGLRAVPESQLLKESRQAL